MYAYNDNLEMLLVKQAKKGDTKAFAELYEQVYIDLYRFALYTMRHPEDAEDAVSETVISAYENISGLKKDEAFRVWIFKILVNICRKKFRQKNEKKEEPILNETEQSENPDYAEAYDVREAFAGLTDEEREIVGLTVFGGYTSAELEKMLGINANTIRSKRSRALAKLAQKLKME